MKRYTLAALVCLIFFETFGGYAQTNPLGKSGAELLAQRQLDSVFATIGEKRNARENTNPFRDPAVVQTLTALMRSSIGNPDAAKTAALVLAWIEFNDVQDDHNNKRARLTEVREKLAAIKHSSSNQWQGKQSRNFGIQTISSPHRLV